MSGETPLQFATNAVPVLGNGVPHHPFAAAGCQFLIVPSWRPLLFQFSTHGTPQTLHQPEPLRDIHLRNVNLIGNHGEKLIRPTEPINGKVGPFLIYLIRYAPLPFQICECVGLTPLRYVWRDDLRVVRDFGVV